jgi:hypothetical protein
MLHCPRRALRRILDCVRIRRTELNQSPNLGENQSQLCLEWKDLPGTSCYSQDTFLVCVATSMGSPLSSCKIPVVCRVRHSHCQD